MTLNELNVHALREAMRYVEQLLTRYRLEAMELHLEPPFRHEDYLQPTLWYDATYSIDGSKRAVAVRHATDSAEQAGMLSAGYLKVTGAGTAVYHPWQQMDLYYPYTEAQYSVTVRAPDGKGSGWAGEQLERLESVGHGHPLSDCLRQVRATA
jgi:hypothetical protein